MVATTLAFGAAGLPPTALYCRRIPLPPLRLVHTVEETQDDDLIAALQDMRNQEKFHHLGISTSLPDLPFCLETGVSDAFQIPYSALSAPQDCYYVVQGAASSVLEFI